MSDQDISYGSFERLLGSLLEQTNSSEGTINASVDANGLVVQVLSMKQLRSKTEQEGAPLTYRAIFSDGKHLIIGIFREDAAQKALDKQISELSVIKVVSSVFQINKSKPILVCVAAEILTNPGVRVGNPEAKTLELTDLNPGQNDANQNVAPPQNTEGANMYNTPAQSYNNGFNQQPAQELSMGSVQQPAHNYNAVNAAPYMPSAPAQFGFPSFGASQTGASESLVKIQSINPFQNKWTIEAAVTYKSDIKTYKNAKGEGKLFSVHFLDDSGEIKATGFNDSLDKYYSMFEVGKTYRVSQLRVGSANKKFSNLTHDYELTFQQSSEVEEVAPRGPASAIYNFISIAEIENAQVQSTIDVIGVVKETTDAIKFVSQKTSKEMVKREITLVDRSMMSIRLTLWGKEAEEFTSGPGVVLACRSLRVGDFQGKNLSTAGGTSLSINPDLQAAYDLLGWWKEQSGSDQFGSLSATGGSSGMVANLPNTPLKDIKDHPTFGMSKPEKFNTIAMVSYINNNPTYPACPQKDCNKKVIEQGEGWYCTKCDSNFPAPEYRYIMQCCISDSCSSIWIQLFNQQATTVFGGSADDYEQVKNDPLQINSIHANAMFKPYKFTITAKNEVYNDISRMRYVSHALELINPLEHSKSLFDAIDQLLA